PQRRLANRRRSPLHGAPRRPLAPPRPLCLIAPCKQSVSAPQRRLANRRRSPLHGAPRRPLAPPLKPLAGPAIASPTPLAASATLRRRAARVPATRACDRDRPHIR